MARFFSRFQNFISFVIGFRGHLFLEGAALDGPAQFLAAEAADERRGQRHLAPADGGRFGQPLLLCHGQRVLLLHLFHFIAIRSDLAEFRIKANHVELDTKKIVEFLVKTVKSQVYHIDFVKYTIRLS